MTETFRIGSLGIWQRFGTKWAICSHPAKAGF
jgi:hypothetical protein